MSESPSPAIGREARLPNTTTLLIACLRIAVGWHFLYEGTAKLLDRGWSSVGYLQSSTGPLAGVFQRLAENPAWLKGVDYLNMAGLILIGLALMLGLFTRTAAISGAMLLALYYLAYPPLVGLPHSGSAEGSYLLVNKNLVELFALLVILVLPAAGWGLDGVLAAWRQRRKAALVDDLTGQRPNQIIMNLAPADFSRRRVLAGLAGVPFLGAYVLAALKRHGWTSFEEIHLLDRPDASSGPTLKFDFSKTMADLKGRPPMAKIGNIELSRLILGGNLMGGWAHARDLIYVSQLVKAYHHRAKIYETFRLAEACGVNAIITNPVLCDVINDYWRDPGGKIQFIADCGDKDILETIKRSIDAGAATCYVNGGDADEWVAKGEFDRIAKALELIRQNGMPAGIGAHKLQTAKTCVEKGLVPDFWMKTLHHHKYWSAKPQQEHDNVFCDDPEGTIKFMATRQQPWIAYKTLAAGAIQPKDGFRYAFAGGADFICVGMYDFQMINDINIAVTVLTDEAKLKRQRPWYA